MSLLLKRLSLAAFAVLVTLLIAEAGLRIMHVYPTFSRPDRTVSYRSRPGARYRWTEEGASEGRMNAAGWRDRDYPLEKPPGVTRILFCGDSFTEALQVPLDAAFHKVLERELNAASSASGEDRRFEVPALGRASMGTTEEYLTWRRWGAAYHPDVVAVLFILNDLTDNLRGVDLYGLRPYFVEQGDTLALDTTFVDSRAWRFRARLAPLKEHSSLVSWGTRLWQQVRLRMSGRTPAVVPDAALAYNAAVSADSVPGLRLTRKILARFARDVHRSGARFVVFVNGVAAVSDSGATGAIATDPVTLLLAKAAGPAFDLDRPEHYLEQCGAEDGYDVVALTPALRRADREAPVWFVMKNGERGHWNARGHAVAAKVMLEYFSKLSPD